MCVFVCDFWCFFGHAGRYWVKFTLRQNPLKKFIRRTNLTQNNRRHHYHRERKLSKEQQNRRRVAGTATIWKGPLYRVGVYSTQVVLLFIPYLARSYGPARSVDCSRSSQQFAIRVCTCVRVFISAYVYAVLARLKPIGFIFVFVQTISIKPRNQQREPNWLTNS